eukprot:TRINITY_DN8045_c0_g1_i4.p2 TRINITY_DN8045_c0_g1~~TRINITY_DN8045_c0_g1_i4.p2  ORF type:complete len:120 (-),score=13.95 TRINITY_DN8045_c0_g1_i4:253-564(-)
MVRDTLSMNKARQRQIAINNMTVIFIIAVLIYLSTVSQAAERRREVFFQLREMEKRHRNQYKELENQKNIDSSKARVYDEQVLRAHQELEQLHEDRQSNKKHY